MDSFGKGYTCLQDRWLVCVEQGTLEGFDLYLIWLMAAQKQGWKFQYHWLKTKAGVGESKLRACLKRLKVLGIIDIITESKGRGVITRYIILNKEEVVVAKTNLKKEVDVPPWEEQDI